MKDISTEQKIYEAAKKIFLQKGLQGARMQEIADEAGINKSLLHYYFRTKEKLFRAIFEENAAKLFKSVVAALEVEGNLETKINVFVEKYIDFIQENPYMPLFMINILGQNSDLLLELIEKLKIEPKEKIIKQLQIEMFNNNITDIKPEQLMINIISLCIFPFIAKPIMKGILKKTDEEYDELMNERKKMLPHFITNAIKINH